MPEGCAPRGRWIYARYVRAFGDTTSQKAHIYEVVAVGTGLPTNPTDPEYLAPGDLIVINPEHAVQVGGSHAFVHFDRGVYAKWDDAVDEPIVLYSTIYVEVASFGDTQGVSWFGDAFLANILALDASITDMAVGDFIIVPKRYAFPVGKRAGTRFLVRAEDVISFCGFSIGIT